MRAVITGGSGFVGTHLIKRLNKFGVETINLDAKNGYDVAQNIDNTVIGQFDFLIHLAALSYVPDSFLDPVKFLKFNFLTTLNSVELCRQSNAKFIYISSYLYGNPNYLPIDEKHPLKPHNPYAYSKLIGEKLCESYFTNFRMDSIVLRPFNLYGYGQRENFIIPKIIKQMKTGKIIIDDPRPQRDFLFIEDFCELLLKILIKGFHGFDIFNVGTGCSLTIKEVANIIVETGNKDSIIEFTDTYRQNEIMISVADISKISTMYTWNPLTSFEKGIMKILDVDKC